jgi:hypothetical protein
MPVLEPMPQGEHSACLGKHPLGESHGIRASPGVLDSLDASDDVGPAELPDAIVKRLVRRVHVRTENSLVIITQDLFEDSGPSRSCHMEKRNNRSDDDPKPATLSLIFPTGLVDVENRLFRQSLPCGFMGRRQGFRDLLMELADRSKTDVNPEDRLGDFLTTPASYSMETRQMGKKCGEPGSKT